MSLRKLRLPVDSSEHIHACVLTAVLRQMSHPSEVSDSPEHTDINAYEVFFHPRVTGACPATTDCIVSFGHTYIHTRYQGTRSTDRSSFDYTSKNASLLLKYNCHICVDVAAAASCVEYLFKYVANGADMAKARIAGVSSEFEQYPKTRYISAAEATIRLRYLSYMRTSEEKPTLFSRQTQLRANSSLLCRARFQISCDTLTGLPTHYSTNYRCWTTLNCT